MQFFHNFVVFLTLLARVRLDDINPTPTPVQAKATVSSGAAHLFSGEDVQMTCSVPDDPSPNWTYRWFHDGELLRSTKEYNLNKARIPQSGAYTCQGAKTITSWPFYVSTTPSDPLNIHVDGGWILLITPSEPLIIEERMTLTCRVRDNPLLSDVIFYKGEVEFKTQNDKDLVFSNPKLEDSGMYSCRATWFKNQEYMSAQSLPSAVTVLDKLETPRLEFLTGRNIMRSGKQVVFKCITKVNAGDQDLSPEYHYFRNDTRLGPATSKDTFTILQLCEEDTGPYTCKVRVRALNVERWSKPLHLTVRPPLNL